VFQYRYDSGVPAEDIPSPLPPSFFFISNLSCRFARNEDSCTSRKTPSIFDHPNLVCAITSVAEVLHHSTNGNTNTNLPILEVCHFCSQISLGLTRAKLKPHGLSSHHRSLSHTSWLRAQLQSAPRASRAGPASLCSSTFVHRPHRFEGRHHSYDGLLNCLEQPGPDFICSLSG
jgi:hypothetical protein